MRLCAHFINLDVSWFLYPFFYGVVWMICIAVRYIIRGYRVNFLEPALSFSPGPRIKMLISDPE